MRRTDPDTLAGRNRLVVVNLDDDWPFVDLVHRMALDLYASAQRQTTVEFRTLSSVRKPGEQAGNHMIWGTRWPRDYGDDTESLLADLIDDLVSVDTRRVDRIGLLVVLPDPSSNVERIHLAVTIARRLEERIDGHDSLRAQVLRIAALRAGAHGQHSRFSAAWWPAINELLGDPTSGGHQPFDGLVVLRRPTVRTEKENVQAHQFILLRCLGEIVDAAWRVSASLAPGADQQRASSAAEFLRHLRRNPVALELPGQYPGLSSEKIGRLLVAYRKHAINRPAASRTGGSGDDAVNVVQAEVNTLITSIKDYVDNTYRAVSPPPPPPAQWTTLNEQTSLWSKAVEDGFLKSIDADIAALHMWSEQCLKDVAQRKAALFDEVLRSRDTDLRKRIASIPLTNAGLNGEAGTMLDTLKRTVWAERTRLLERAGKNRLKYVFAILPSETSTAPTPQVEAWFERLAIERLPEYAAYESAHKSVHGTLRKLIPRRYWLVPTLVGGAALATIAAHELAPSSGRINLGGLGNPVLTLAWLIAAGFGIYLIASAIKRRRTGLRLAVGRMIEQRDALAQRVHEMLDSAVGYLVVTTQIIWLDLLCNELDRRGAENDVQAYTGALSRIDPDQRRHAHIPVTEQEEMDFFKDHSDQVSRERVTRWLTVTLDGIDPETDLAANRVEIAFAGSLDGDPPVGQGGVAVAPPAPAEHGGNYALDSRLFLNTAKINYRTLVMPQSAVSQGKIHAP